MISTTIGQTTYLTVELLNRIEELANLLTYPQDIAYILQVDEDYFARQLKDKGSKVYTAFYKGYLRREIEIRQNNQEVVDVDIAAFSLDQLKDFKTQLILFLDA